MQCGGCGTLIEDGQLTCPNCGRMVWSRGKKAQAQARASLPRPGDSSARMDDELELSEPAVDPIPGGGITPGPDTVRDLLAREPERLEDGLSVLTEKNQTVGVGYRTDVGPIDLLARDGHRGLVVVMVSKGDSGADLVAEILQRIGWVRKHVARVGESVRGMVVMDQPPANLSYTAAAVADTVSFRTYRMTLSFDEVEI